MKKEYVIQCTVLFMADHCCSEAARKKKQMNRIDLFYREGGCKSWSKIIVWHSSREGPWSAYSWWSVHGVKWSISAQPFAEVHWIRFVEVPCKWESNSRKRHIQWKYWHNCVSKIKNLLKGPVETNGTSFQKKKKTNWLHSRVVWWCAIVSLFFYYVFTLFFFYLAQGTINATRLKNVLEKSKARSSIPTIII